VGINAIDLMEKTQEEFNYRARGEKVTPDIISMRYYHFENRRRKKLKIVAEYIKKNRQHLQSTL
jgi:hypothetical protein